MTNKISSSVDVAVPVNTAYNQWTQFEEYPRFMKHVKSVRQVSDKSLHWTVTLGGAEREFDTEIVEQIPDQRIAWRSVQGLRHHGLVSFQSLGPAKTRLTVLLEYDPEGVIENVGSFFGVPKADLDADLARFIEFIEKRGVATDGWRGTIKSGEVRDANSPSSPGNEAAM
jgi:uncharacterized membrane protein